MSLTDAQVTAIRTSGLTDTFWAQRLRVQRQTVRRARIGESHRHLPIPPDIAPRDATGCTRTIRAGLPQQARPLKKRRGWE